jgi:TetR/AcrR family fatty acid metabolism transcriptional regulator
LECLYSKEFYASRGYQPVRQYAKVLTDILRQGTEEGRFRRDLDIRLVRDVVLGTLGCEIYACVALEETLKTVSDHEDIISLIHAMITPGREDQVGKSDRILKAAERIFAEMGFAKAKVSEIAKRANVAEGTVYEYFKNKEDLLLSLPEKRFKQHIDQMPDLFVIKDPLRKLRRFTRYFFAFFLRNRDFLKVFLLEIQMSFRFSESKAVDGLKKYFRVIEEIIEQGKSKGRFRPDVNARVFRNMFIGSFNNLALNWFILKPDRKIDKMQQIEQLTDLLCSAVIEKG